MRGELRECYRERLCKEREKKREDKLMARGRLREIGVMQGANRKDKAIKKVFEMFIYS